MPQPPNSSRLFPDAPAGPPGGVHIAQIDGASRGNPGPAAYAVIVKDASGKPVFQLGKKLGRQTNNVAEYYALLAALDYAVGHGIKALRVRSDSELLVRQIKGQYKVKSADLKPLHERALKLSRQLEYFVIEHVMRELNRDADALANLALDGAAEQYGGTRGAKGAESDPTARSGENREIRGRKSSSPRGGQADSGVSGPHQIRARIVNGALVPTEPLNLPEGAEVVITVVNPRK